MIKSFIRAGLVAGLALASVAPTMAQSLEIGPNGVRVRPDDDRRGPPPPPGYDGPRDYRDGPPRPRREIGEREAARIARSEGMREVDDVYRQRRSIRVEGADRRGRDMTVIIDSRSGDVIDVR
ncbi:MAG: PepSY domain-containing protein [Methylobacterium sp.]